MASTFRYDVFLSHNGRGVVFARQIVRQLRAVGISVFFEDDSIRVSITAGDAREAVAMTAEFKSGDSRSTSNLIGAAREGDAAAKETLFGRYLPVVRQIVALRMGYRLKRFVDIEDIVQNCLLKVLRDLPRFEERSEGGFRNWLAKCVERARS